MIPLASAGKQLLNSGGSRSALAAFDEALALAPIKSSPGGNAALQKAIALDNLRQHEDARKLYAQLRGHNDAEVARTAKRMEFGFQAGAAVAHAAWSMNHAGQLAGGMSSICIWLTARAGMVLYSA